MRRLNHIVPPLASDYSGVCAVARSLGAPVVVCDAGCCCDHVAYWDDPRQGDEAGPVMSAALGSLEAVMGDAAALVDRVVQTLGALPERPWAAALVGTPVPAVTGMDLEGVAAEVSARLGSPVLGFNTTGFSTYADGELAALDAFERLLSAPNAPAVEKPGAFGCGSGGVGGNLDETSRNACGGAQTRMSGGGPGETGEKPREESPQGERVGGEDPGAANEAEGGHTESAPNTVEAGVLGSADRGGTGSAAVEDTVEAGVLGSADRGPAVNLLGVTPFETGSDVDARLLAEALRALTGLPVRALPWGDGARGMAALGDSVRNVALSAPGVRFARLLERRYGTPYDVGYPPLDGTNCTCARRIAEVMAGAAGAGGPTGKPPSDAADTVNPARTPIGHAAGGAGVGGRDDAGIRPTRRSCALRATGAGGRDDAGIRRPDSASAADVVGSGGRAGMTDGRGADAGDCKEGATGHTAGTSEALHLQLCHRQRVIAGHAMDTSETGDRDGVLVVHDQVVANSLRTQLRAAGCASPVHVAALTCWIADLAEEGDRAADDEQALVQTLRDLRPHCVVADPLVEPLVRAVLGPETAFVPLTYGALSGKLGWTRPSSLYR